MPEVPGWLLQPPTGAMPPPVDTREQLLPLDALSWDDFQRLILRVVREEADVQDAVEYGRPGDPQYGIDLFARRRDGSFASYQCRRVATLGAAQLRAAVDAFRTSIWAGRSRLFVLATSADARGTAVKEAHLELSAELRETRIDLEVWGRDEISERLKSMPSVVDDFFGREWVRRFCGPDAVATLGHRLPREDAARLRARLRALYASVFGSHEGATLEGRPLAPLPERFVAIDVIDEVTLPKERPPDSEPAGPGSLEEAFWKTYEDATALRGERPVPRTGDAYEGRRPFDAWLSGGDRAVLVGDPGSGKSTVLRFLALDLLSDKPVSSALAVRWGERTPLWLPFGLWTRLIAGATEPPSLESALEAWLRTNGAADLAGLVTTALEDDRLLLLVDGLDEWANEDAARVAHALLQSFVDRHRVAVVATSRPYGYARLRMSGEGWRTGRLAALSRDQRAELVRRRLDVWERDHGASDLERSARVRAEVERFLGELDEAPDLADLARVPLLLVLLLVLRSQNVALPQSRREVYARLVDLLLRDHPAARRSAALLTGGEPGLRASELRAVARAFAYQLQERYPEGVLPADESRDLARNALLMSDLPEDDARRYAGQFVDLAEGSLGILVRLGDQIFMPHRSVQEYLAADHALRLPTQEQRDLVSSRVADPRWSEVLRFMLTGTDRSEETENLLAGLAGAPPERAPFVSELRAEVAFSGSPISPSALREITREAFERVNTLSWLPHRARLLELVLRGAGSARTRDTALDQLQRWAFAVRGRQFWIPELGAWPATGETVERLVDALHDEEDSIAGSAARALARVAGGDDVVGRRLLDLARRAESDQTRAFALLALNDGWPSLDTLELAKAYRQSPSPSLRVAAIIRRVAAGVHDEDDLGSLLSVARWRHFSYWMNRMPDLLAKGWSGRAGLRDGLLQELRTPPSDRERVDETVSYLTLFKASPGDEAVADLIIEELAKEHPFLGGLFARVSLYRAFGEAFHGHAGVTKAVEDWAERSRFNDVELAQAAFIGPTPRLRDALIAHLDQSFPHHASGALLSVWTMADATVASALRHAVDGPRADAFAYDIFGVLADPAAARARLLGLLRDPKAARVDFIVSALGSIPGVPSDDDEVVRAALPRIGETYDAATPLMASFGGHPEVRSLALRSLDSEEPAYGAIARGFAGDEEIRGKILRVLSPLPKGLREHLIALIARPGSEPHIADAILARHRHEEDREVRTAAAIAMASRASSDERRREALIQEFRNDLEKPGFLHEVARESAFAGLLAIGEIDALRDEKRKSKVELMSWRPNVPLFRLISRHWRPLSERLGEDLGGLLEGSGKSALAPFATESPALTEDLLREFDQGKYASDEAIQLLAAVRPTSNALRTAAVALINSGYWQADLTAVIDLLLRHFGRSDDLYSELTVDLETDARDWPIGVTAAVAVGWPDSPALAGAYEELRAGWRAPALFRFPLWFSRLPAEDVAPELERYLRLGCLRTDLLPYLRWSVRHRLARDANAVTALLDRYASGADMRVSVSRLVASAGRLDGRARELFAAELRAQVARADGAELGLDIVEERVQAITVGLTAVLQQEATAPDPR